MSTTNPKNEGSAPGGAGSELTPLLDCDPSTQFTQLKRILSDTSGWTAGESATYYAFFLHGWLGRSGDGAYQDRQENPGAVLYQSSVSGMWYVSERAAGDVAAVRVNGKVYKAI